MFNSDWITYENFYYFFSDMGEYITASDSHIENVMYNVDRNQDFSIYSGKLAVAGNSGLKLYTSSGRLIIDDTDKIGNPRLEASERYLLMYDLGGTEFRVYNMFTKIFSTDIGRKIYGSTVSDSGDIAVITEDGSHNSSVCFYNSKFKLIKSYNRSDYVVDVSLDQHGKKIAILSYSFNSAGKVANVYIANTSSNEPNAEIELNGSFQLYCAFTKTGVLNVVCDDRIISYDLNGRNVSEELFGTSSVILADVNKHGAAVVIKNNYEYSLTVFDISGKKVYNGVVSNSVEGIRLFENSVFTDGDDTIQKINIYGKGADYVINKDFEAVMLIKNENEVLLCLPSRIKYISFE
jgi:hypothetical protein